MNTHLGSVMFFDRLIDIKKKKKHNTTKKSENVRMAYSIRYQDPKNIYHVVFLAIIFSFSLHRVAGT